MSNASPADIRLLTLIVKVGLVIAALGWGLGTWYLETHHALGRHHHKVYLEHEASESLNSQLDSAKLVTRELKSEGSYTAAELKTKTAASRQPKSSKVAEPRPESLHEMENAGRLKTNTVQVGSLALKGVPLQPDSMKRVAAPLVVPAARLQAAAAAAPATAAVPPPHQLKQKQGDEPRSESGAWGGDPKLKGSIFVSVAAYREQRGPRTIASAFQNAKNPDLLFIGLYQQWDPDKDPDGTNFDEYCGPEAAQKDTHPLCSRIAQVSKVELHWTESQGPCVARAEAERMYSGQEFAMQIDSHSTFVPEWDEMMLRMWAQTSNEFAVLSGYPRSEGEMGRGKFNNVPMICEAHMLDWSVRDMLKNTPGFSPMRPSPVRTPYFGAGLVFAKAHRLKSVAYDPHLHYLFDGEEFDMAMRLFTNGYDVYAPNETPLFHFYSSPQQNKKMGIQKFWDYQWGKRFPIMFESTRRIRHKVAIPEVMAQDPKINQTDLTDLGRYQNGDKRTVRQFLAYAGIDLIHKKVPGACKMVRDHLPHVPWNAPFAAQDPVEQTP